jgi:predicted PurR-regulated permease PerM
MQMTNDIVMKIYLSGGAVFVELVAQYFRGLARSYRLINRRLVAGWLWAAYMVYIIVFAFLSAVGVFWAETDLNDQMQNTAIYTQQENRLEIEQLNKRIATLQNQLDREGSTGTGPNFRYLQSELDEKTAKRDKLSNTVTVSKPVKSRSVYNGLHELFVIPANWFKMLMFGSFVLMIYLSLITTPWQIEIEDTKTMPATKTAKEEKRTEPRKVGTLAQIRRERSGGLDHGED